MRQVVHVRFLECSIHTFSRVWPPFLSDAGVTYGPGKLDLRLHKHTERFSLLTGNFVDSFVRRHSQNAKLNNCP